MVKISLGSVNFLINQTEIKFIKKSTPKTYKLINGAEIIEPVTDNLEIIEFSGHFESFSNYMKMCNMLKDGNPQNLMVTGINIPINMYVLIESFTAWETGGDIDAISYKLRLKEFVSQRIKVVNLGESDNQTSIHIAGKENTIEIPNTYITKKGDTLSGICKQFLGDEQKYKEIAILNNIKNANLIQIGQVIKLK